MSRKIARITQEKKLLLVDEVVESNAKTSLNSDGRLDTNEIIEYPAELEGGRNLIIGSKVQPGFANTNSGLPLSYRNGITTEFIKVSPGRYIVSYASMDNSRNTILHFDTEKNKIYAWTWSKETHRLLNINSPGYLVISVIDDSVPLDSPDSKTKEEYMKLYLPKLEKGSIATPWTPAPEDLGLNYPDSIQNFNSSISGNNIIAPEFIEGYPFTKPVIDDSLVLWFDGSTGNNYEQTGTWKDLSDNGNDGQLINFGFTEDSGWGDGGLKFDGVDDCVDIRPDFDFGTDSFTIEIMSKHYSYGYPLTNFAIANNNLAYREGEKGFQIGHGYSSVGVDIVVNDGTNLIRRTIGKTPKLNEEVHAVFVFDRENGNVLYFYDGELVGELDISEITGDIKHSNLIRIGYIAGWRPNMSLYSFRLYNRVLTDEEILQNYQAGQCSPLLAMRGDV